MPRGIFFGREMIFEVPLPLARSGGDFFEVPSPLACGRGDFFEVPSPLLRGGGESRPALARGGGAFSKFRQRSLAAGVTCSKSFRHLRAAGVGAPERRGDLFEVPW